jgi:ArsR family transcriptional regulator, arsenate/arsenite/antimonite-responsive transcriptional repressor
MAVDAEPVSRTGRAGPGTLPPECRDRVSADALLPRPVAESIATMLKAVADPARLQILYLIRGSATEELCVCELTGPLQLSQPTVSHHLRILFDAGLLQRERRGAWSYYRLAAGVAETVDGLLSGVVSAALAVAPDAAG